MAVGRALFQKVPFYRKKKTKTGRAPATHELMGQKLTTSGRPILGSCDHLLTCTLRSPADEDRPGQSCIADGGVVLHAVTESVAMQRISRTPYLSVVTEICMVHIVIYCLLLEITHTLGFSLNLTNMMNQ